MALIYAIGTGKEKITTEELVDAPEFWDMENAHGCIDAPNLLPSGSTGSGWKCDPCLREQASMMFVLSFPVESV